jgi:ligand-binding SRPBCC domain-containing protein
VTEPSTYTHTFPLPANVEDAFALFADPRYLDLLTPSWFRLRPAQEIPDQLGCGFEISYRIRWRGLPLRWTSRLTDWQPPAFFAYEQLRGPYAFFRHEHCFVPTADGTEVRDHVLFRTHGGRLIDRLVARPDLERIFVYRERQAVPLLRERQAARRSSSGRQSSDGSSGIGSAV